MDDLKIFDDPPKMFFYIKSGNIPLKRLMWRLTMRLLRGVHLLVRVNYAVK